MATADGRKKKPLRFDVIVIGGGLLGLSAAYNCAREGKRVAVIERSNFYNQSGSSGDLIRMFRTMYTEYELQVLAYQAKDLWQELEEEYGQDIGKSVELLRLTGQANFGDEHYGTAAQGDLKKPRENLKKGNKQVTDVSMKQVEKKYNLKNLRNLVPGDRWIGYENDDCGVINVPETLRALRRLADGRHGSLFLDNAEVYEVHTPKRKSDPAVRVKVRGSGVPKGGQELTADKCIITCGVWTNDILKHLGLELDYEVWEMVYEYFATDPDTVPPEQFPKMWVQFATEDEETGRSNLFYGFPSVPWGPDNMVKLGWEDATMNRLTLKELKQRRAEGLGQVATTVDVGYASRFVKEHCVGIDPQPAFSGVCLHAAFDDYMSVLGRLPRTAAGEDPDTAGKRAWRDHYVVCAGGWAAKFTPSFGRMMWELAFDGKAQVHPKLLDITRTRRTGKRKGQAYLNKLE
ncbi:FAD-dependent oxidoreductase [Streptomyces phytophilus]|uniref:FAD-dependent oxidoreductase n=1 Tax=Streptomyces phytophilus TaxID=722715 RepID=UPI0015F05735|nr:FAD-dependent oxidoreductase [Streptomyces phytophilus]